MVRVAQCAMAVRVMVQSHLGWPCATSHLIGCVAQFVGMPGLESDDMLQMVQKLFEELGVHKNLFASPQTGHL